MTVTTGTSTEYGREESWAEATDYTFAGDSYVVRVTALHPYKDFANNKDELYCHIDVWNVTKQTSGRYEKVWLPERKNVPAPQGQQHLRRHSAYAKLNQLLATTTPDIVPSPVYPTHSIA